MGRAHRQKRGGNTILLSLDEEWAESRYRSEPAETVSAEKLYDLALGFDPPRRSSSHYFAEKWMRR
jgi:hypothetical protein